MRMLHTMSERPTPPSEFDLPLSGTAVWAGPDGLGDSSFDDVPPPQAVELPPELGDDPRIALRRTLGMFATKCASAPSTSGVSCTTSKRGSGVDSIAGRPAKRSDSASWPSASTLTPKLRPP